MVISLKAHYVLNGDAYETENGYHGTETLISYGPGIQHLAAGFGRLSSNIKVDAATSINNIWGSGGTVMCWIKVNSAGGGAVGRVLDKDSGVWYISTQGFASGTGSIVFFHSFDTTNGGWQLETPAIVIGKWHHIVVTYDKSSTSNDAKIYVDGNSRGISESFTPAGTADQDHTGDLYIGNDSSTDKNLDGFIDDLRIYTGIATQAEIAAVVGLYNQDPKATPGRKELKTSWPNTSGTVAYSTKQAGRERYLVPVTSKLTRNDRWGLT